MTDPTTKLSPAVQERRKKELAWLLSACNISGALALLFAAGAVVLVLILPPVPTYHDGGPSFLCMFFLPACFISTRIADDGGVYDAEHSAIYLLVLLSFIWAVCLVHHEVLYHKRSADSYWLWVEVAERASPCNLLRERDAAAAALAVQLERTQQAQDDYQAFLSRKRDKELHRQ